MNYEECSYSLTDNLILLRNSKVEIGVDSVTGSVALLRNRLTGSQHITCSNLASIFRLRYLLPGEMWVDVESNELQLSRFSVSDVEGAAGKCVRLEYDNVTLRGSRGILGSVSIEIALKPVNEEITWAITVVNKGKGTLQEVWFPLIRGIKAVGHSSRDDTLIIPDRSGERIVDPLNRLGHHGDCVHIHYPKRASMQWMDLCDRSEGIYMVSYDMDLDRLTALHAEKEITGKEASLLMSFVMYPFVPPGGRWSSARFGLALHPGDWHWGADRYRAWAATWIRRPELPEWLAHSKGVAIVIAMGQDGPVYYRFGDLPGFFAEAQKLGVNTLFLFGWSGNGFDTLYPEYSPVPELGGEQGLKAAIAKIREMGGHTLLYMQYRLMDVYSHFYAEVGRGWAMKSATASPRPTRFVDIGERERTEEYRWPGRPQTVGKFALPCPYLKEWRHLLTKAVVDAVANLGADGVHFDQLCSTTALFCHDGTHGHTTPASHWAEGHRRFLEDLTGELQKLRSDFCISGEGTNDILGEYVHIHSGTVGPVIGESFPELFRYTFPWHRILQMSNHENELMHTFVTGRLFLAGRQIPEVEGWRKEDPPEYLRLFRELADLKSAKREYLVCGRFMDNVGLAILGGGGEGISSEPVNELETSSFRQVPPNGSTRPASEEGILAKWHLREDGMSALICVWNRTGELEPVVISFDVMRLVGDSASEPASEAAPVSYEVAMVYPEPGGIEGPREEGLWNSRDLDAGIALSVPGGKLVVLEVRRRL
ncbi:MAG: hypothetical protein HYY08_03800 [Firmicutes bacterium]|nr:hypothetical protein [Bacillota bacterium]